MAELLNVKIKIRGMWHAGSYDPSGLFRKIDWRCPGADMLRWLCSMPPMIIFMQLIILICLCNPSEADTSKIHKVGWPHGIHAQVYYKSLIYPKQNGHGIVST